MNYKHLFWIVPLMLVIGFGIGFVFGIPTHIEVVIDYGDNVLKVLEMINDTQAITG